MSVGQRLVRIVLRLLPPDDRREYAADMETMTARRRAAAGRSGLRERTLFWARELRGAVHAVVAAWLDRVGPAPFQARAAGTGLDLRAAVRSFSRQPLFLMSMVATLATGIGVNAAMTALGWSALWAPLPYPDAERLVRLYHDSDLDFGVSLNELERYRARSETLAGLGGWSIVGRTLDDPEAPARVTVARVTPGLFTVLGRPPAAGRAFDPDGSGNEVVLSHRFWTARFGRANGAVGSSLSFDGVAYTVVGILPPDATYPDERVDAFTAIDMTSPRDEGRGPVFLDVVARMHAGTPLAASQAEITALAAGMREAFPRAYESEPDFGGFVVPLRDAEAGEGRALLLALLAGATLVLIATCLNVATLLASRAYRRMDEARLRLCLGASRLHVLRTRVMENALVACLGGAGALALASAVAATMGPSVSTGPLAAGEISTTTLVALVIAATGGVLVLLTAGSWTSAGDPSAGMIPGRARATGASRFLLLTSTVQMVAAVVLVGGSILLGRTVHNLVTAQLGFETRDVVTARVSLPSNRYPTNASASAFFDRLIQRIEQRPDVRGAGLVNALPLSEVGGAGDIYVEAISPDSALMVAETRIADEGYFPAMGIPLLAGRLFTGGDGERTPRVALVDETFARRFFDTPDAAIGQRVRSFFTGGAWAEVVGVVGHTRHSSPGVAGGPQLYVSTLQRGTRGVHVVVAHESDDDEIANALRVELSAMDPRLPIFDVRTMEGRLSGAVARERLLTTIFAGFALMSVALSALGTYSVVRLGVDERLREIGIRRAVGAPDLSLVRVVASVGVRATAIGVPLGVVGAFAMGRVLEGMVFGVPATDAMSLAAAAATVTLTACLACVVPVRRASRTAPAALIRDAR